MKIITCNFRGRKHQERNEPCEDSVFYSKGSKVTVVAVADGAGSKKYEHAKDGADAVTKAVCQFFEQKFDDFFDSSNELELRTVIQTICHKALKERAKELELDSIETMASTLLAVAIKGNKLISVQIGDGLIGRYFHGELEPVNMPQNGEFASSTYFVNSAEAYKMIQVRKMFLSGTSHLFLMTDGIADCMFNDFNGVFNKSLYSLLEAADDVDGEEKVRKAIKEFIVDADPKSDDCTMAIVCFNEKTSVEYETPDPDSKAQETTVAPAVTPVAAPSAAAKSEVQASENPVQAAPNQHAVQFMQSPQVMNNGSVFTKTAPSATDNDVTASEVAAEEDSKPKKLEKWKIITIIVAAVLIIVVAGLCVVLINSGEGDDSRNNKKDSSDNKSSSYSQLAEDTNQGEDKNESQSDGTPSAQLSGNSTEQPTEPSTAQPSQSETDNEAAQKAADKVSTAIEDAVDDTISDIID